jgi:alanine racemase
LEHTTIDLDDCGDVRVGDEVTLLGNSHSEQIHLTDYAAWHAAGPLDVLMNFSGRAQIQVTQRR